MQRLTSIDRRAFDNSFSFVYISYLRINVCVEKAKNTTKKNEEEIAHASLSLSQSNIEHYFDTHFFFFLRILNSNKKKESDRKLQHINFTCCVFNHTYEYVKVQFLDEKKKENRVFIQS